MSGYQCTMCEGEHPAVFLVTNLATGDTLVTCADDMPVMLVGSLAQSLELPMDGLYKAVQQYAKREADKAAKATTGPANVKDQPGPRQRRARERVAVDGAGNQGGTPPAGPPAGGES